MTTIPKGQINAPDQLDCMSTLRKIPVRLMKIDGVLMTPEVAKVVESLQDEIERLRTSLEMSQASPLSEEAMDILRAENDKLNKQIWDSNDVKVAMAIKHTTEVNRLKEEVERLQKLKDYWADIVHSERKEYNALQDSTMHDEATIANLRGEVGRLKAENAANAKLFLEDIRASEDVSLTRLQERDRCKAALRVALDALEYHTIQTRPIHSTDVAIETLREAL